MAHILMVKNDAAKNGVLTKLLKEQGHCVDEVFCVQEACEKETQGTYDLLIMDALLSDGDCFSLCRSLPQGVPVVFCGSYEEVMEKSPRMAAQEEEYLILPLTPAALQARVAMLLACAPKQKECCIGNCKIDFVRRLVTREGENVALTPQEYSVLATLARHPHRAMSREALLQLAWGYRYCGDTRTVDVHIQKIRKKLDLAKWIQTVYKLGYRLEYSVSA